jgi:hypothetical protein
MRVLAIACQAAINAHPREETSRRRFLRTHVGARRDINLSVVFYRVGGIVDLDVTLRNQRDRELWRSFTCATRQGRSVRWYLEDADGVIPEKAVEKEVASFLNPAFPVQAVSDRAIALAEMVMKEYLLGRQCIPEES